MLYQYLFLAAGAALMLASLFLNEKRKTTINYMQGIGAVFLLISALLTKVK